MPIRKKLSVKKVSEEQLQISCLALLRFACPEALFWHTPNGVFLGRGNGKWAYMAKLKMLGMLNGVPDLCILWKGINGPEICFVELKVGYNKLTPEQVIITETLKNMGFKVGVAKTLEEFITLIKSFGVPIRKCMYGGYQL